MKKTRILFLGTVFTGLIFWLGFIMGSEELRKKIVAAFKAGDTKETINLFVQCQKAGEDVTSNPLYWLAIAKSFSKRGDLVGVRFNLDKAIDLLLRNQP